MLDGILCRGFSARCKSLIKLTMTKIDAIRRKRNAMEMFLKKDIADLIDNGLDINAYGRAEGLLIELTLSSCYVYIELCCQFLLKQLSSIKKVSDCPENCREALSSLIYAAARFSDLPELRELREALQERYGQSLDQFVNQEFAERMENKQSNMENKVKLMQDIALEFSISWDAKAFDQRMSRPPSILDDSCHEVTEVGNRNLRNNRRRERSKKALQVLFDNEREQNDKEERTIDMLLMYYSKKPSTYKPRRLRRKDRSHHGPEHETHLSKFNLEVQLPLRSISLPNEPTATIKTPAKTFIRTVLSQPDSSNRARHVHPKLPEYDDLVARLASLRGS